MKEKFRREETETGFVDLDAEAEIHEYLDDDWEEEDYYEGGMAGEGTDDPDGETEGSESVADGYLDEDEEEDEEIKARYLGEKYEETSEPEEQYGTEPGSVDVQAGNPDGGYRDAGHSGSCGKTAEMESGEENDTEGLEIESLKDDYAEFEEDENPEAGYVERKERGNLEADGMDSGDTGYLDEEDEEMAENECPDDGMQEKGNGVYSESEEEPVKEEGSGRPEGDAGEGMCGREPAEGYLDDGDGEEDDYIEDGYENGESVGTEEGQEERITEDIPEDGIRGDDEEGRNSSWAGYRKRAADWKKRHIRKDRQTRKYQAAGKQKGFRYRISHTDVLDHIVASAGVLVLAGSVVLGTVYANERTEAAQVASFSEIGTQMEGIAVIGESGLLAMTDAQNMKAAVAEAEAAGEAAAVKEYEEKELYEEGSIEVEMHLSSVQRDLKIKFVNKETGRLIPSVPFEVTVVGADKKSYVLKDEDMDGIIYLASTEPGDFSVAMMEAEYAKEYAIPTESVPITVKDTIEYKKVDVADEIKKESEVNTAAEDTKRASAAESSLEDTVGFVASTKEAAEKTAGTKSNAGAASKAEGTADVPKASGMEESAGTEGKNSTGQDSGTTADSGYEEVSKENIADPAAAFSDNGEPENDGQDSSAEGQEGDGTDQIPPGVTLSRNEIRLLTNHSVQLSARVKGMEDKSVAWISDNSAVAAVALDGTVTGVGEGTATVMVICNGDNSITAFCAVTVQPEPAADHNTKLSDKNGNALYVMNSDGTFREAVYADYYTADKFYQAAVKGEGQGSQNQEQDNQPPEDQGSQDQEQDNQPSEEQDQEQDNQPSEEQDQEQDDQPSEEQGSQDQEQDNQPPEEQGNQTQEGEEQESGEQPAEEYKYTGWQTIDGKTYYFDADGNKVTGEQVIQGAKYTFGQDGVLSTASGHMGIDVSRWNGSIDWNAVKNSGVSYVIIRCGYRGSTTGALIEDSMFRSNIQGASSAGLKVGIYFVTQAVNEVEAVEEASMVLSLIGGYHISYPVFLDVEPSGGRGDGISKEVRTGVCRAFCQTIANSGYSAGIYASNNWLNEKMDAPALANYKIWMAHYAAEPGYTATRYDMWQYSAKGKVAGISGDTDLNISYLGY